MSFQQYTYSAILILLSIAVALFAHTRWRMRALRPTAGSASLLLGCASLWILVNGLEVASVDLATALLWNRMEYVAIAPVPILWFVMALQFARKEDLITASRFVLLVAIPALCLGVLLSDRLIPLFMSSVRLEISTSGANLVAEPGPFMVAFYVYGYLLVIAGGVLVSRRRMRAVGFAWQGQVVLLGVALTIAASILDWSRLNPFSTVKLTPLAIVLAILGFIFSLMRARRADLIPIARGSLAKLLSDAVLVLDVEGRIIDLNPAAELIVGMKADQVFGRIIHEVWSEWPHGPGISTDNDSRFHEFRLGEGENARVFDVRASQLDDRRGHSIGQILVLRDITERAQVEKALQFSEKHFRSLIENATDLIVIVDESVGITYVSPSILRTFGYALQEIVGHCSLEFVHPEDYVAVASALAEALETKGGTLPVVARFRRADGEWRKLECIINNMLDQPAVRGLVVNARDVTERETVADALRESEERYRLHFANINDVIYSFDTELKITSVSPSVERILGVHPDELIGASLMNLPALDIVSPAYFEKAAAEAVQVLGGERITDSRYEFLARDGTSKLAEISTSPIVRDGQIIGAVNVARDITERVRADERIRASLQEKEVLLKEIHHRVKNNLQIVSSLLSLQATTIDNPQIQALFRDSQNRINSMALIHERLYRSTSFAFVDFSTYLRDLIRHLFQSYRTTESQIELIVDVEGIQLDIDTAIPCGLLVSELVSNALKHAFCGRHNGTIGVVMRDTGDSQIELQVWDDGQGFSPEKARQKPSSLGIQLVKRLASQLGGNLEYDVANGTRVTIQFPKRSDQQLSSDNRSNE